MATIGIVGGGISGLTAAYLLQRKGLDVQVFEASNRPGGVIRSVDQDGYLVECGPNLLRPRPPILPKLIQELGLIDDVISTTDTASTRYIVRDGSPRPLPQSLWSFVTTNLFSTRAKLRLLVEPFIGVPNSDNESVASFARRRLGSESLDYAVNPVVGGTFAGDPERLSMRHVFETLYTRERKDGSLLGAALQRSHSRSNGTAHSELPSGPFSFRGGLERLPQALANTLGPSLRLNSPVRELSPTGGKCCVTFGTGDKTRTQRFDSVISTIPLHRLASVRLDTHLDCAALTQVPYPPVGVITLGFPRNAVGHSLSGFGLLVPEAETAFDTLGTIFSSSLFPHRAPEGHISLTTFVGGMRNRSLGTNATEDVLPIVLQDLDALLSLTDEPSFIHHVRLSHALPQYTLDHDQVQATLRTLEETHPSLFFAGNYRRGISVGSAMASGARAARRVDP